MNDTDAEFLILLAGTNETLSQTVHSRSSYKANELVWSARIANMFMRTDAQETVGMNVGRIHDIEMTTRPWKYDRVQG